MGDSSLSSGFVTGFGSASLQFAFERFATFGSLAWREIGVIWGVEDELRKLQRTYLKIQDLVDHMEGSPLRFSGGSKAWQMWFEDLRKLAYDADALLDHVSLHLSSYCTKHSVTANQESQVLSMVLSSVSELKLPHKITDMQKKLDELAKEMESLVMIEQMKRDSSKIAPTRLSQFSNLSPTASFVDGESVVGRIQDKQCIVDLLEKFERSNYSVIPVVGMGGVGKTTLARLVFDDDKVRNMNFGKRIWVSMSLDFDVVKSTKSIIEAATLSPCHLSDWNSLQVTLQSILQGRKFFLVLDDYWSESHGDWDVLCSPFAFGAKGSKILVTTRSTKVSSIVSSQEAYKLEVLSDDDCWMLIKQRAWMPEDATQRLEPIGRKIANKCKGLPLAAITLGSVLRSKSTQDEWRCILESELWDMPQNNYIYPSLMLSYLHLPAHLQRCFAYCSIFPRNHEFEVEELVLLWMAEGFIQPAGVRRLEDLGHDYFNGLHSRSFFQLCKNTSSQVTFKMHDLIHDMARLVSKDICFHLKYSMLNCYPLFGNACHLSLHHDNTQPLELKAPINNERLRTFLVMGNNLHRGDVDSQLFSKLQSLRVLGLSGVGLTTLSDSVDQLKYVRYLNLSGNPLISLPETMCKLVALQTLKLKNCPQLQELPKDMSSLSNLRHLVLDVNGRLRSMPLHFRKLTSLQTLSVYIVGPKKGNGIGELKNIDCLKGSLCIKNIERVSNASDAGDAKLSMKSCLDILELKWGISSDGPNSQHARVLENLKPHENLKELVIENYRGISYPHWLSNPQHKFTNIYLQGLRHCDMLPSLGQLPSLKYFAVLDMPCLRCIDHNFYGSGSNDEFPSLESFQLCGLPILTHWTNVSDSAMPRLNAFTVQDCPNLISLPQKLQYLLPNSNVSNCPSLQPAP